jgi:hypothetical protein
MQDGNDLMRDVAVLASTLLLLSGCATTATPARLQSVRVSVVDERGTDAGPAHCGLSHGRGAWTLQAPGSALVSVDAEPLHVRCTSADGKQMGEAWLARQETRSRNMLIGAGVGLAVGAAAGESQRRQDNRSNDFMKQGLAPVGLLIGTLLGALVGTGAGASAGNDGYADSVRITLKPLPVPTP